MSKYILAIDQGTTSSRSILFDHKGAPVAQVSKEFRQIYPKPGWVEHDASEIWESQLSTIRAVIEEASVKSSQISAIGITNQRETAILWDRNTGKPVYNAIVWQCRRTAEICDDLRDRGFAAKVLEKTGLVLDAYFSGTKIKWLLDNVEGIRDRAEAGEICFGTVDSWLLYNLTGGKVHATDLSNASRTMIFNIRSMEWDEELLDVLGIPKVVLPEVRPSSGLFGACDKSIFGDEITISGIAGDQQAALFGQACFEKGFAKNTYGTGCFMLMNTGSQCMTSKNGLLTTIAWGLEQKIDYALEGPVFVAGAAVQWLRDEMGLIDDAAQSEALAIEAGDSDGVYFVPAFVGLGAPYWDMYARGSIVGLTRGSGRTHIVRATLEAIAFQVKDLVLAMEADSGVKLTELRVDGGAVGNSFLMQFQADILGVPVVVSKVAETTALGAAYLAGLAVGFWKDRAEISTHWQEGRRYLPEMSPEDAACRYAGWKRAIERSKGWAVGHGETSHC